MEVLDVGVIFPIAIRLWRAEAVGLINDAQMVLGLQALESWLVRRMTMRLTGKNYNRSMLDLLKAMSADSQNPVAGLIRFLRTLPSNSRWPTDVEFREYLLASPLYGTISQSRLRMLLEAAEARLYTTKTEKFPIPPKLTIEHVIPQTWEQTWPLPADATVGTIECRNAVIHRLGNLTLVTSSLNPALSNDPWATKRAELAEHSALRLNARLVHDHPTVFDDAAIDQRGKALAELLIAEWPGPDSTVWDAVRS